MNFRVLGGKSGGYKVVFIYSGYNLKQGSYFPGTGNESTCVKTLCVSNAAGGMNPAFEVGEIMIITQYINLFPTNPFNRKKKYK
ncbi:MAG: hypothetical protein IPJ32_08265 [Sphingobacteriaceae bacterium]|nr:hypothetical protein [Sphingobacteriaceae bacterium]